MIEAIDATKQMILECYTKGRLTNLSNEYGKIYLSTNENVDAYLEHNNFNENEKALSVLASGDQAFNLVIRGISNIDTFDINKLTEYYALGFKRTLICKYSYKEFLDIYNKILNVSTPEYIIFDIIKDLLPQMDVRYRKYWQEILSYWIRLNKTSNHSINIFSIIGINHIINSYYMTIGNTYLQSETNYNLLKHQLYNANITFKHANAANLPDCFSGPYDYLLLSNILDYIDSSWGIRWGMKELRQYLNNIKPIMNEKGLIYLYYSLGTIKIGTSNIYLNKNLNDFEKLSVPNPYVTGTTTQNYRPVILKRVCDID